MKKRIKKFIMFAFLVCFCVAEGGRFVNIPDTAYAKGAAKSIVVTGGNASAGTGNCNIQIEGNDKLDITGRMFNIYKIFDAIRSEDGASIRYVMNPDYKNEIKQVVVDMSKTHGKTQYTLEQVNDEIAVDFIMSISKYPVEADNGVYREFIDNLKEKIKTMSSDYVVNVKSPDAANKCTISGLDYGYYLVDEITYLEDKHTASSICLVTTTDPGANVKLKGDYPSIIKKIQEDDPCNDIADENRWNDIGDYEIGQTIPFKFETYAPDMKGYLTYDMSICDEMDPCIGVDLDSVVITIEGKDVNGANKKYKLKPEELDIDYVGLEEETNPNPEPDDDVELSLKPMAADPVCELNIYLDNIKGIIVREFLTNSNGEVNENYGQKITVNYNGFLKDEAALRPGRPGFENDVYMYFYNDPDYDVKYKYGKTPTDTVVCFTYGVSINKVNDKGTHLKDAGFRLYRDKECKQEVCIKKFQDRYVVKNADKATQAEIQNSCEIITGADGNAVVVGLDAGTYYVKETTAPKGYYPLIKPIEIKVQPKLTSKRDDYIKGEGSANTLISLGGTAHIETLSNTVFTGKDIVLLPSENMGLMNLDVLNKINSVLPRTGTSAALILSLSGMALMVTVLVFKKKNKN